MKLTVKKDLWGNIREYTREWPDAAPDCHGNNYHAAADWLEQNCPIATEAKMPSSGTNIPGIDVEDWKMRTGLLRQGWLNAAECLRAAKESEELVLDSTKFEAGLTLLRKRKDKTQ